MSTLLELRAAADAALESGDEIRALKGFLAIVKAAPRDIDARLRIADCLQGLGDPELAKDVYLAVATRAARAGYPLKALVALKVLEATDREAAQPLLTQLDDLYGKASGRIGRGVRATPPDLDAQIDPSIARLEWLGASATNVASVAQEAAKLATSFDGVLIEPEILPPIPVLSELRSECFDAVALALKTMRVKPGGVIVREGDVGQSFFALVRGTLAVTKKQADGSDRQLATLHEGALFGEMAIVSASPRKATVIARTHADVLVFDREAMLAATQSLPREIAMENAKILRQSLDGFARDRLLQNLFQTAPFFKPFDRQQRLDAARRFVAHTVAAGTIVIKEGQEGKGLFVILDGEMDVSKIDGSEKVLLATLREGDVFGEISVLRAVPATATVTAGTRATLMFLGRDYFLKLLEAMPEVRKYVDALSEERMMDTRLLMHRDRKEDDVEIFEDEITFV